MINRGFENLDFFIRADNVEANFKANGFWFEIFEKYGFNTSKDQVNKLRQVPEASHTALFSSLLCFCFLGFASVVISFFSKLTHPIRFLIKKLVKTKNSPYFMHKQILNLSNENFLKTEILLQNMSKNISW